MYSKNIQTKTSWGQQLRNCIPVGIHLNLIRGTWPRIHEPEANNCFSIITQVIIEIPKQRNVTILPQFAFVGKSHAARINVSRNAFLNSRSKENIFFDVHTGWKQIKMWFCGLYSYRQWVHFITLFPNNVFLLLLHVERVCKSSVEGTPRKIWWGCAARFPKPLPYLWLKSAIFPTLFMTWPKIRNPIYDPTRTPKSCFRPAF